MTFTRITAGTYEGTHGAYRFDIERDGSAWTMTVVSLYEGYGVPIASFSAETLASAKSRARSYASRT